MSTKNVNNYKWKSFRNIFGQLHTQEHKKADSEASAKWKHIKEKPDKIN